MNDDANARATDPEEESVWVTLSLPARLVRRLAERADGRGMRLDDYLALIVTGDDANGATDKGGRP
ncbi:hypothetical protein Uis1B_2217 [Bifidobacterium margollesii]|uniref:CopG family transcriptional regulator n=1 Tax=Bifidobacterium margollesii TaxID=2020964 RepID=A0A2N5J6V4_9BIFI|nr:hypothetical protein [Bifidobacterium margollesii]PLS29949.1 hypothetical protein Uis1B_2217 [Bifidobacterium margollesii]